MANNARVVTYYGGILWIREVLDKFTFNYSFTDFGPEDRITMNKAIDLFKEIESRGSKALLDINVDDLVNLDMDVNYIRVHRIARNCEAFENFYQLLANIRMIKQRGELDRIVSDHYKISYSKMYYAKNDVDMTKEVLNRYFGVAKIKEEEKMIKPVKVIYNDMSATVFFNDFTKVTVTCTDKDKYDESTAIALAYTKRMLGSNANSQWQKSMQVVRQSPKFDDRLLKDHNEFIKLSTDIEWLGYELGMWSEAHCIKELSVLVYNIRYNDTIEYDENDYYHLEDLIDMIKDRFDDSARFHPIYFKLDNFVEEALQEKESKDSKED